MGTPEIPGDCEVDGVTTIGVSVTEVEPGVVVDVLVNTGTGGKFDKFKRGAGALKRPCIVWVCAAWEGSGPCGLVFVSYLGLVSRRVGDDVVEEEVDILVVASFISTS